MTKSFRNFLTTLLFVAMSATLSAGIYNNNNHSAAFLRNPSRSTTFEIDGVYYNPAGLVFGSKGWNFGINNQSAWQTRSVTSDFVLFGGKKTFEAKIASPIIPSIYGSYVGIRWAISGYFLALGGGGTANYKTGLPSFESAIRAALTSAGIEYDYSSAFEGTMLTFAAQLGVSYKISDNLSAFAGVRGVMHNNEYDGFVSAARGTMPLADMQLKSTQKGLGFAPILGFDFNYDRFTFAAKYEFRTSISTENSTENITAVIGSNNLIGTPNDPLKDYADGVKWRKDMPALLTVAASYGLTEDLKLSIAYWHHFNKAATVSQSSKYPEGKQSLLSSDGADYQVGLEYTISDHWLVSGGVQISRNGMTEAFGSDMEQTFDSESYGFGFRVSWSEKVKLDLGCYSTHFHSPFTDTDNYTALDSQLSAAMGTTIQTTDTYSRSSFAIGLGISFNF